MGVKLNAHDWHYFALSDLRQFRLRNITRSAQRMGLLVGAEAAIAITQQVRCTLEIKILGLGVFN